MTRPKAAFLGLGMMGAAMARRLLRGGMPLTVWNRSPGKAEALAGEGAVVAPSPAAAASGSALVFLCLKDKAAMEQVLFGPEGVGKVVAPETIIVDLSTTSPAAARSFASGVRARWLDCPVTGGVAGAKAGSLTLLVGGAPADLEEAAPALNLLAARMTLIGPVGAGQAAKLCNQLIVSTNMAAIAEAIALGEKLGINAAALPAALAGGFADSRPLQIFGPRMAAAVDPGPSVAAIGTMRKDVAAILIEGEAAGARLPLTTAAARLYAAAAERGLEDEDLPSLVKLYRQQAGHDAEA